MVSVKPDSALRFHCERLWTSTAGCWEWMVAFTQWQYFETATQRKLKECMCPTLCFMLTTLQQPECTVTASSADGDTEPPTRSATASLQANKISILICLLVWLRLKHVMFWLTRAIMMLIFQASTDSCLIAVLAALSSLSSTGYLMLPIRTSAAVLSVPQSCSDHTRYCSWLKSGCSTNPVMCILLNQTPRITIQIMTKFIPANMRFVVFW